MDRRQQKSQNAIIEAFCNVLKEKDYHKITVQEIIDRANVGRSTFYSHFETKDILLIKICDDLFEHIFTTTAHNYLEQTGQTQSAVIDHILFHIQHDNKDIVGILISQGNSTFLAAFKTHFYQIIDHYLLENETIYHEEIPLEITKNHIYCSFLGIMQMWIQGGYALSIETVRTYYMALLSNHANQC